MQFVNSSHFKKDITDKAYIVNGAIDEIKDTNTRQSLQILPYDLVVRQPNTDSIKYGKFRSSI